MGGGGKSKGGKGEGSKGGASKGSATKGAGTSKGSDPGERRAARKIGRRAEQLAKLDAKGEAESNYFWECKEQAHRGRGKAAKDEVGGEEIFQQQCTFALDFGRYESVEVTLSGPGAKSVEPLTDFRDLGAMLPKYLGQNLELMQYRVPTPIQKHALPLALKSHDLMCCAQTGSGKTCAFLLPVVAALSSPGRKPAAYTDHWEEPGLPRCVVMAPTRELAQQIHTEAKKMCHNSGGLRAVVVYGGAQARQQLADLARGCDIVVATPGRLTDFVDRGVVELRMTEHLVLDEADRMLDMGFEPQIRQLVLRRDMPQVDSRHTMMFSATFPPEIQKLAAAFLKQHVFIAVGRVGGTTEDIEQRLLLASPDKKHKYELLLEQLEAIAGRTLVFVQKKRVATQIKKWLRAEGINAEDIHGDRSQSQREAALAAFRSGECRILCATDVAARGLDIPNVTHVINFDLPTSPDEFDSYVHRIGRTGRAGNTGISTSMYVPGRDPKVGNAGVAAELVKLFNETKNHIPDWFLQLPDAVGLKGGGAASNRQGNATADIRNETAVRARVSTGSTPKQPPVMGNKIVNGAVRGHDQVHAAGVAGRETRNHRGGKGSKNGGGSGESAPVDGMAGTTTRASRGRNGERGKGFIGESAADKSSSRHTGDWRGGNASKNGGCGSGWGGAGWGDATWSSEAWHGSNAW